jgi:hypothetical protein
MHLAELFTENNRRVGQVIGRPDGGSGPLPGDRDGGLVDGAVSSHADASVGGGGQANDDDVEQGCSCSSVKSRAEPSPRRWFLRGLGSR